MTLQLTLHLPELDVPLGAELKTELTLVNTGSTPLNTASLFDNNMITNYVLSDALDRELVSVNQVTRQLLFEKVEPNTTDERRIQLAPGQSETRADNFCRYHWIALPGVYHLRGSYRYQGRQLLSDPVRFLVRAAPLEALDTCWNYHYAERFSLYSAWCAAQGVGAYHIVLRESARFAPTVVNSNAALAMSPYSVLPKVSFNRSALAGGSVWVAYLEAPADAAPRLVSYRTHPTGRTGPFSVELPHPDFQWLHRPLCAKDGSVLCLLQRKHEDDVAIWGVVLDEAGQEVERGELILLDPSTRHISVCCDVDGMIYIITWDEITRELCSRTLSTDPCGVGNEQRLGTVEHPVVRLLTPPLLGAERYVATLSADTAGAALCFDWWKLDGEAEPVKRQRMLYERPERIVACDAVMDAMHPVCLIRADHQLDYLHPRLNQSVRLWQGEGPDPMTHEQLVLNGRGDVFLSRSTPAVGITDRRLHLGSDFDLAEVMAP